MAVHVRIQNLCKHEGSPEKVARKAGIDPVAMQYLVKPNSGMRVDTLLKIIKAYPKLNPLWLLLNEGDMWKHEKQKMAPEVIKDQLREGTDKIIMLNKLRVLLEKRVLMLEKIIKNHLPHLVQELGIN